MTSDDRGLRVEGVTVRFGGLVAVDGVSLTAPTGVVTGLIGPNGAGKTTTFNVCSGLLRPDEGTVQLHGEDISSLAPSARAQRGLGRTFQRMELYDSLTVTENVRVGREAGLAASNPIRHLIGRRGDRQVIEEAAQDAMARCGIEALAHRRAGSLSTGQRRLVELARAVAGGYDLLLLDEPSSGLDPSETTAFGDTLLAAVASQGTGILIVEHDMGLVMGICDYIHVLDFGRSIFEGSPAEVAASDVVRSAYLGAEELDIPVPERPTEVRA